VYFLLMAGAWEEEYHLGSRKVRNYTPHVKRGFSAGCCMSVEGFFGASLKRLHTG